MSDEHFGWIKLHRQVLSGGWLQNPNLWTFWCYCLLRANHEPAKEIIKFQRVNLRPGQFIFGRKKASADLKMSEQSIRTCLKKLRSLGNITLKSTNRFSIVTICNWEDYQAGKKEINQHVTSKQPASNQQVTTNKNDKNDKNDKNVKNKEKDMFRTTEENVVQEPLNGKFKKFSDFDWSKDLLEIIGKYPTLELATTDDIKNVEFWDGHVDIMSDYFPTDAEMKRWFNKTMFDIQVWQTDNKTRASKTSHGLRRRINRWLSKAYLELEVTKR